MKNLKVHRNKKRFGIYISVFGFEAYFFACEGGVGGRAEEDVCKYFCCAVFLAAKKGSRSVFSSERINYSNRILV